MTAYEFLSLTEVSPVMLQQMEDQGIDLKVTNTGLKLVKDGEVLASVPLSTTAMQQVMEGKAGSLTKAAVQDSLASVISSLGASPSPLHAKIDLQKVKPGELQVVHSTKTQAGTVTPEEMDNATPVPLNTATQMYQPVRGGSGTSRYFCLGVSKDLKLAARWMNQEALSIRVEGDLKAWGNTLSGLGLQLDSKRASVHLNLTSPEQASKAVGGLLCAIPVGWETPLPSMAKIYGKGS